MKLRDTFKCVPSVSLINQLILCKFYENTKNLYENEKTIFHIGFCIVHIINEKNVIICINIITERKNKAQLSNRLYFIKRLWEEVKIYDRKNL